MSQLNTPFTYWNANPFNKLKAVGSLCTKNFNKIIVTFKNGVIWGFKISNKSTGKKEFIPTLCLLGHETTVTAITLVKLNIELSEEADNAIVSVSEDGPCTLIGELISSKNPQNPFDEADIQCIEDSNSQVHVISVQNINNSAGITYWSFYSCVNPSYYVTYYRKNSTDSSNSGNTTTISPISPIQSKLNTPISSTEDIPLILYPYREIQFEELWNVKFENYPKKSLVTAVTSFSSLFIIFGYESGMIKVMPLYYPFLYDINSLSEAENEVFTLDGHSSRITTLFVPKKIDTNGKLLLFSSSNDASIIIWDLETGKQLYKYNEYTRAVVQFVQVPKEKEKSLLQNCVIAFSDDNSISIFSLEKLEW
ncbi:hypothetical protein PIROE2DRAFT_63182 [Piromyces sp. E2]|nr:hypothetical protein PIROE2DRAFT_63182 [Piromyces sp. E2]|eukprot:OUM60390.1 hypothetical protein PIROE2DRAFT_63182 [Piromyces sp. E2]